MAELLVRVDEKLTAMDDARRREAADVATLGSRLDGQQLQLAQLATDMAVLKTQHASFYKGVTILLGFISMISAAIGWTISTFLPFVHR